MIIDDYVLAIMPRGAPRGGQTVLVNAATGLVGYPAFTQGGIVLQTEFNPSISFHGLIKLESILTPANGTWRVVMMHLELDAETPGGAWFTQLEVTDPRYAPVR